MIASVEELERRLDRVAVRQVVSETLISTTAGLVLCALDESLRRSLIRELRQSVSATASAASAEMAEALALEMEERFDQLLDQIERLAHISGSQRK
jgi:hypothetical protein